MNIKTIFFLAIGIAAFLLFMSYHYIYPLLLILWMYYSYSCLSRLEKEFSNKVISDFWLNLDQKIDYRNINASLGERYREIEKLQEMAYSSNISKNKDGSYSNRSNLGKKINEGLRVNNKGLASLEYRFKDLKNMPLKSWEKFVSNLSTEYGVQFFTGFALISYIILFIIYFKFSKIFSKTEPKEFFLSLKIILLSVGFGFIAFLISKSISKKNIISSYPKPPIVHMDNLDKF